MCKVKVLLKAKDENGFEKINKTDINHNITKANNIKLTHHKCGDLTNKTIAKTSKNSKKSKL